MHGFIFLLRGIAGRCCGAGRWESACYTDACVEKSVKLRYSFSREQSGFFFFLCGSSREIDFWAFRNGIQGFCLSVNSSVLSQGINEHRNDLIVPSDMLWPNINLGGKGTFFGGDGVPSYGEYTPPTDMLLANCRIDANLDWKNTIPWLRENTFPPNLAQRG